MSTSYPIELFPNNEVVLQWRHDGSLLYKIYVMDKNKRVIYSYLTSKKNENSDYIQERYQMQEPGYISVVACEKEYDTIIEKHAIKHYKYNYIPKTKPAVVRVVVTKGKITVKV
ncbi:MAG TPA: hypothetical protein PLI14_06455 [Bacilli bacterium]|jgi:hypothetical protein|nr:hypothetical protein [Bacilli bacterium]